MQQVEAAERGETPRLRINGTADIQRLQETQTIEARRQPTGDMMDYFKLATELTRAEAAPILARVAQKQIAVRLIRNDSKEVCCCSAYNFPHRSGGGNCPAPTNYTTDPRPAWEAEERTLFDANEARSINAGNAG